RMSTLSTLAHSAVFLVDKIRSKKETKDPWTNKFSSLIYGAMTKTGNQWKPISGGIFPLDFLYKLMDSNLEISGKIFNIWDHMFNIGNRKGLEDLAFSLSEFIAYPTIENLEKCFRVHLKYLLDEKVKIRAYENRYIMEVMKNVRS
ncbi:MAG: hypothetical protein ACE5KE_07530, partial [Methanosarcinales archaeon]